MPHQLTDSLCAQSPLGEDGATLGHRLGLGLSCALRWPLILEFQRERRPASQMLRRKWQARGAAVGLEEVTGKCCGRRGSGAPHLGVPCPDLPNYKQEIPRLGRGRGASKDVIRLLIVGFCVNQEGDSPPGCSPGKRPCASRAFSPAVSRTGVRESRQETQPEPVTMLPPMAKGTVSVSL